MDCLLNLTDIDTYQSTFKTVAGDDIGFKLTGETLDNAEIIPGQEIFLNVTTSVSKSNNLFVFVKIVVLAVFSEADINTRVWHPIEERNNVYFFGHETSLLAFEPKSGTTSATVFDKLTFHYHNRLRNTGE